MCRVEKKPSNRRAGALSESTESLKEKELAAPYLVAIMVLSVL